MVAIGTAHATAHRDRGLRAALWTVALATALLLAGRAARPAQAAATLSSLSPASQSANNAAFTLTIFGAGFLDTAAVLWNGSPRVTTIVNPGQLQAAIPASDLSIPAPIATVLVGVNNGDGSAAAGPLPFVITGSTVSGVQTVAVPPGGTATATAPPSPAGADVSATLSQGASDGTATLTVVTFGGNPTGLTVFAPGSAFSDVRVTGSTGDALLTATFTFPPVGPFPTALFYINPATHAVASVRGSTLVANGYTVNAAARTITVVFDASSAPRLAALSGTTFVQATLLAGAPVAANDFYFTPVNTPLVVGAPGVLQNDLAVASDEPRALLASTPAHGSLTFSADGSFVYTPAADFLGPDSFSYVAQDVVTGLFSAPATAVIGVGQNPVSAAVTSPAAGGVIPLAPQPAPAQAAPLLLIGTLPQILVNLRVNVTGCGGVTPGDALHMFGDNVLLTAAPCAGWRFAGWAGAGSGCDGLAVNPCTVAMPPNDIVVTAFFTQ